LKKGSPVELLGDFNGLLAYPKVAIAKCHLADMTFETDALPGFNGGPFLQQLGHDAANCRDRIAQGIVYHGLQCSWIVIVDVSGYLLQCLHPAMDVCCRE
jgi:hypothetical protein